MQIFSCDVRRDDVCKFDSGAGGAGGCPPGCSLQVGDQCYFSEDEAFNFCPWDSDWNFNSFRNAIVLLVFVTTGENWVDTMEKGMRHTGSVWPGLLFFLIFYIVSFYMLLNLFVGVILEEFELSDDSKEGLQVGAFRVSVLKAIKQQRKRRRRRSKPSSTDDSVEMTQTSASQSNFTDMIDGLAAGNSGVPSSPSRQTRQGQQDATADEEVRTSVGGSELTQAQEEEEEEEEEVDDQYFSLGLFAPPTPNSHFPDAPRNLRAYARIIVRNAWFERVILLTIIL
eukprot:349287-Hanusia_phi.AAC.1